MGPCPAPSFTSGAPVVMSQQYLLEFTEDARRQIGEFAARDRAIVVSAITEQLSRQPTLQTRNRKPLRSSSLAAWELPVDRFRVFYIVDGECVTVLIVAIGEKRHNKLYIDGEEISL